MTSASPRRRCRRIALATPTSGQAADEHNVTSGITTSGAPLALHGVDAVALSLLKAIAPGDANHGVVQDGVAYYFASAESARLFIQAPAKYMPQYGGFCAYAVALGKKFDGDPRFADIVDGKLYLFVNAEIFAEYLKDKAKCPRQGRGDVAGDPAHTGGGLVGRSATDARHIKAAGADAPAVFAGAGGRRSDRQKRRVADHFPDCFGPRRQAR